MMRISLFAVRDPDVWWRLKPNSVPRKDCKEAKSTELVVTRTKEFPQNFSSYF